MRSPLALIALSLAVLTPAAAQATASFPFTVQADLSLSYEPPCTICHDTLSGGTGTVTRDFGKAMRTHGLAAGNTDSVGSALTGLETDNVDSDCDGTIDVQQLKDGRDPNTGEYIDGSGKPKPDSDAGPCAAADGGDSTEPAYGCGAQISNAPVVPSAWAVVAALGTIFGLALSRRRRPTRT